MISAIRTPLLTAAFLLLAGGAGAAEFSDKQRDEIGVIVREYLLQNPEVLIEMSQELEKRQKVAENENRKAALTANADEIFRSPDDFVAGAPGGDVTMVEFFDYNCPWCKKSMPILKSLMESDKGLKLVLKEFPILGENSEYAARAALAAKAQGKYMEFHFAMYEHEGKLDAAVVDGIAQSLGLDVAKMKTDMESPTVADIISRNRKLAETLGINGTPGFVIDDEIIPGYVPKEGLAAAIKEVRDSGGCKVC